MPGFTILTRTPPRFDGDFQITAVNGHQIETAEQGYLAAVDGTLDLLAAEESRDSAAGYPSSLLEIRRQARRTAGAALRADAEGFANGQLSADVARNRATGIGDEYRRSVPKLGVKELTPGRFEGDFEVAIVAEYAPTEIERQFLDRLNDVLAFLATDETTDAAGNYSQGVLAARKQQRKSTASELRSQAEQVGKRELNADIAANNVLVLKGMYRALRDRLTSTLFKVTTVPGTGADEGYDVDLKIEVRNDLPSPNETASQEKQELFAQINNACTVIRTVCQRTYDRASGGWYQKPDLQAQDRVRRLRHDYIGKLAGIGRIGLEGAHSALGKLALTELKNGFVAQEAGRIKNTYVRWLGLWAAVMGLLFLTIYVVIRTKAPGCVWWQDHKSFLLAATGAAIGTWVSFSIRRVQLSFEELTMLEEGSLDPPLRILFVVALTLTACLLFWTGAMNIEIGNLKTNAEAFKRTGTIALLIGVFAGLSERALATAISGRAAAFVKTIGGG